MGNGVPMEKIRNLSIRKTIFLYLTVTLTVCFLLSVLIMNAAERIQERVWLKYIDQDVYAEAINEENDVYIAGPARPPQAVMSRIDAQISEICDFFQTYTVLLLSVAGSAAAVCLFYRHKLKTPLRKLEEAAEKIKKDELDFQIVYDRQDEMGHLCREFEKMRGQLESNNKKLWQTVEEEKILRSAVAHDIRSPLAVLKGYQEMLLEFLESGGFDREQVKEIVREEYGQTLRLEHFVDEMRKLSSIERRELKKEFISLKDLKNELEKEIRILAKEKRYGIETAEGEALFGGDKAVILEVTENLLENAFRYAREEVQVEIMFSKGILEILVCDDGRGFQRPFKQAAEPFYSENAKDTLKHSGLGMYISRLYCERHGGYLAVENKKMKGAAVKAVFREI